jgi:hypothetical protein
MFQKRKDGNLRSANFDLRREDEMTKNHGSSVKDDKQYEGLREKGMSKERAAKIANSKGSSKRGGENSGGSNSRKSKRLGVRAARSRTR